MSDEDEQMEGSAPNAPPLFLQQGFRPFFLFAGLFGFLAVPLWVGWVAGFGTLPAGLDALAWHRHEMLFGFAVAAVSGFILTAVPNWTGRAPVAGAELAGLAGLWLAGRLAFLLSASLPAWLVAIADIAYLVALVAVAAREIIGGGNQRNLVVVGIFALLCLGNILIHVERLELADVDGAGQRLGLFTIALLITLIGGRVIPAFTGNWLRARGEDRLPAPFGALDRLAVLAVALLACLHAVVPEWAGSAWFALVAAVLHGARLARWCTRAVLGEPLLWILHLAYGWLVVALALLGLSGLTEAVPANAALHALSVGAIATMILAVSTRASLGHTGRVLSAGRGTLMIYLFITLAALCRVVSPFLGGGGEVLLWISAGAWTLAFGLYTMLYFAVITGPRVDG